MKKALYKLQCYYESEATDVEKPVLRYILDNTRYVTDIDIHKLAKLGFCSAATIVRLCKKNGFKGFKDLKIALLNDLKFKDELVRDSVVHKNNFDKQSIIREVFNENIIAINSTYNLIDYDVIDKILELIKNAKVIRLYGIGASYLVAKDFQQKLERINKFSILYEETHMQILNANNANKDDLCVLISYSGQTKEIIEMAKNIKSNGGQIISLTQYSKNKLMSIADYNLFVPKIENSLRLSAGSSRISQLTVIDFLYHSYLEVEKNYIDKIIVTNKLLEKDK